MVNVEVKESPEENVNVLSEVVSQTKEKPYLSLTRKNRYLFEVTYDTIPEPIDIEDNFSGLCSSYVQNGKLYRQLDWKYNEQASFHVILSGVEGMAFIEGLNDKNIDDTLVGQLPYHIVDGKNDKGIMVAAHVLYNDFNYTNDGNIPLSRLPYIVLSRVKSMDTIEEDLDGVLTNLKQNDAQIEEDYLLQVLVTDGTTTCVLSPSDDGTYEVIDATSNPKLTNFKWVENATVTRNAEYMQDRPNGIERWNMIPCELEELRYTKAYETPDRLSDFIGINGTSKYSTDEELLAIYNVAHQQYPTRTRDGTFWQTMHSVVYSHKSIEHLYIQENWDKDYIFGGIPKWNDISEKPFTAIDNNTLKVENDVLRVDTTDNAEQDNTKPITSSGVHVIVGNIDALLSQI